MSAFANIVIADALGTPVNHTFVPVSNRDGLCTWQDQSAASNPSAVPVGFNELAVSGSMSKDVDKGRGRFALDVRYRMPTLETVSNSTASGILPAPIWAYDCSVFIKTVFSARSTLQNRKDAVKMAVLAYQNAQVDDWLKNYQMPT
jgi:hypothetical protein